MAQSAEREPQGGLARRILSSLALAPPVAAAVYAGSPYFEVLVALAAVQLAWEWSRLCGEGSVANRGAAVALALAGLAVIAVGRLVGASLGIAASPVAALLIYAAARPLGAARPLWLAAGVFAIVVPCISFLWLRLGVPSGRDLGLWLLAAVWATDIGAYAAGRGIGGPKLWPRVSPRKTWAGLAGGIGAAAAVSAVAAWWLDAAPVPAAAGLGALTGGLAQLGDLAESAVKRHFGVKDSGGLIPGHGGLLDRIDGLIATLPAVAVLTWLLTGGLTDWR